MAKSAEEKKAEAEAKAAAAEEAKAIEAAKAAAENKPSRTPPGNASGSVLMCTSQQGLWGDKMFFRGKEFEIDFAGFCTMSAEAAAQMAKAPGWRVARKEDAARREIAYEVVKKREAAQAAAEKARIEAIKAEQKAKEAEAAAKAQAR